MPLGLGQKGQNVEEQSWRKNLSPGLKRALIEESKGKYFTGLFRDGIPIFTRNRTSYLNPVTGLPVILPEKKTGLTIAEHEAAASRQLLLRDSKNRTFMNATKRLAFLKKQERTLTKKQRYDKHVLGLSKETLQRMHNGTLVRDSAWGPRKAIVGSQDRVHGDVWGGPMEGAGRKRRDATWFRAAAIKGSGKAQVQLALAYREGQGVKKNLRRAAGWFARASRQGNRRALYCLAEAYRYGEGVKRKNSTALMLLGMSARRGFLDAQRDLGIVTMEGRLGLKRNASAALKWLDMAGKQRDRCVRLWFCPLFFFLSFVWYVRVRVCVWCVHAKVLLCI